MKSTSSHTVRFFLFFVRQACSSLCGRVLVVTRSCSECLVVCSIKEVTRKRSARRRRLILSKIWFYKTKGWARHAFS